MGSHLQPRRSHEMAWRGTWRGLRTARHILYTLLGKEKTIKFHQQDIALYLQCRSKIPIHIYICNYIYTHICILYIYIYVWGHVKMYVPPKLWCRKKLLPRNRPSQGVLLITHGPQLARTSLLLGCFTCLGNSVDSGSNYDEPSLTTINMLLNIVILACIKSDETWQKRNNEINIMLYIYIIDIYNIL